MDINELAQLDEWWSLGDPGPQHFVRPGTRTALCQVADDVQEPPANGTTSPEVFAQNYAAGRGCSACAAEISAAVTVTAGQLGGGKNNVLPMVRERDDTPTRFPDYDDIDGWTALATSPTITPRELAACLMRDRPLSVRLAAAHNPASDPAVVTYAAKGDPDPAMRAVALVSAFLDVESRTELMRDPAVLKAAAEAGY